MRLYRSLAITALSLFAASCTQAPIADIEAARRALLDARRAQAAEYAPGSWSAAQDTLAKLDAELSAQRNASLLARSYTNARQLALTLKDDSEKAAHEAENGKEKARFEADKAMEKARRAYDCSRHEADLASIKSDSASIESTLQEMQQAYDASAFPTATLKAREAAEAARRVPIRINQARRDAGATRRS